MFALSQYYSSIDNLGIYATKYSDLAWTWFFEAVSNGRSAACNYRTDNAGYYVTWNKNDGFQFSSF